MPKLRIWLSWGASLLVLACSADGGDGATDASNRSGGGCPYGGEWGQLCGVKVACDPFNELRVRCILAHSDDPCAPPTRAEVARIDECSFVPATPGSGSGGGVPVGEGPGGGSSTGSGSQPGGSICTAYADHECDLCDDGDCSDSQWNYAKGECEAYYDQCPGYFECVFGASSCDEISDCPHC
jgi:hypothetical protein